MTTLMQPRNPHLSYSRLSRFEQCPASYHMHYVDRLPAEPGIPLRFGSAVHAALEHLVREHVQAEQVGPLSRERATALWQEAWSTAGLSGLDLFREGLDLVHRFVEEQGVLDHQDVLAVEEEFRLPVGEFEVLGYLDRVDRVDDETIEVIDYKTNRLLFTRDELEASLQMSLYHLAAQALWPWAKKVRLTFWMLRHGVKQTTERTPEDLDATRAYVETLGTRIANATDWPAQLNANCVWCDHKRHCPAYAEALEGKRDVVCEDLTDLEAVAAEREDVSRKAKVLWARKAELERVLKTHLAERDELVLGGVKYRMLDAARTEYPLEPTLAVLAGATGESRETLLARVATADTKAVRALMTKLRKSKGRAQARLLETELDAVAKKTPMPRLWGKAVSR